MSLTFDGFTVPPLQPFHNVSTLLILSKGPEIDCRCTTGPCRNHNNTCKVKPPGACYFFKTKKSVELDNGKMSSGVFLEYGCTGGDESSRRMTCEAGNLPHKRPQNITCCNNEDLCNEYLTATLREELTPLGIQIALGITILLAFLVIFLAVYLVYRLCRSKKKKCAQDSEALIANSCGGSCSEDWSEKGHLNSIQSMREQTSGSGSGLPILVQRTVSRQLVVMDVIGNGRYGRVNKGRFRFEDVAVKTFQTLDEQSWAREIEIYETTMLRHANILGFIASDISGGEQPQLILIVDYYELGSLYDFLKANTVSEEQAVQLAQTAVTGLAHLHMEIHGTRANPPVTQKPAIAHRDIKSKNILVKRSGNRLSSVIGDFGLAVKLDRDSGLAELGNNTKVGTVRYMAPEVLSGRLNQKNFHEFKMADLYSTALVLWEIGTRAIVGGHIEEYAVPYKGVVQEDPSIEEMRRVICDDVFRPIIPPHWADSSLMNDYGRLVRENWAASPDARPSALHLKKRLHDLLSKARTVASHSDQVSSCISSSVSGPQRIV